MAITKITRDALNTGIDDNSDATAITIDSSENCGFGTTSPSYRVHSVAGSGSGIAGYFRNSAGSGNGTALVARGGANNSGAPTFIVQDYNGNEDFKVDGLGRVTMPSQPSFLARGLAGQPAVGSVFVFNGADYNRGNCYSTSNGRFTAPVNGFYMFTCHVMGDSTDNRLMIRLFKNGTHMSQGSSSSNANQYQDSRIAFMMYMAAGDYAEVKNQGSKNRYNNGATHNHFAGHLLG